MLDFDLCYRAMASRDARFDGRFFVGVRTTGIYCRPVCPARTPKPENVRFFACAAAAREAGLRPCKRCRPETAPGTPEWVGGPAVVGRALRLIEAGRPVSSLPGELHVGARQLRRLFAEHLGATPSAVAADRRLALARMLIDQTTLSMAEVALAAGFGSVRQFNSAVRAGFGATPRELRARGASPAGSAALRLRARAPFYGAGVLEFLRMRALPGVEEIGESWYRRTAIIEGRPAIVSVDVEPDGVVVEAPGVWAAGLAGVVDRTRAMFDLDADPETIGAALAPLGIAPGLRVPGCWDPFELAVRAILGQQVTVAAANRLAARLVERHGTPLARSARSLTHLFPAADVLAEAGLDGMPASRARAVRALAAAVSRGDLALDRWADPAEARARLLALPGIGPWTADYIALRALRDPDAYPAGDAALPPAREGWRPWRAYAAVHHWGAHGAARLAA